MRVAAKKLPDVTYGPATSDMRTAFGEAVEDAIRTSGLRRNDIGAALGVTADAVTKWTKGDTPPPLTVFGLETLLGLPPGELSRHLGYQPTSAPASVVAAIEADDRLDPLVARVLIGGYKQAIRN